MKNGNPATKALILFLMAPKGLFLFSPLLLKKYLPKEVFQFITSTNFHITGTFVVKIGLSLALYAFYNKWRHLVNQAAQSSISLISSSIQMPSEKWVNSGSPLKRYLKHGFELSVLTGLVFLTSSTRAGLLMTTGASLLAMAYVLFTNTQPPSAD